MKVFWSPLPDCEDWCCSAHYSTIHRVRGRGIDSCKFSTFCFLFNIENQTCPDPWSQSLIFDTNLLISRVKEWGIPAFLFWHLIELLIDYRLKRIRKIENDQRWRCRTMVRVNTWCYVSTAKPSESSVVILVQYIRKDIVIVRCSTSFRYNRIVSILLIYHLLSKGEVSPNHTP